MSEYTAEPSTAGAVVVGAWVVVGARVVVVVGASVVVVVGGSVVVVVDSPVTDRTSVVVVPPPSAVVGAVVDGAVLPAVVAAVVVAAGACVVVATDDGSVSVGTKVATVADLPAGCSPRVVSGAGGAISGVVFVAPPAVGLAAAAVGGGAGSPALQAPAVARRGMSNTIAGQRT